MNDPFSRALGDRRGFHGVDLAVSGDLASSPTARARALTASLPPLAELVSVNDDIEQRASEHRLRSHPCATRPVAEGARIVWQLTDDLVADWRALLLWRAPGAWELYTHVP